MNTEHIQTAEKIFHEVVDLDPANRDAAVVERCGRNTELLAYVRRLLTHHDHGMGDFLRSDGVSPRLDPPEELPAPDAIGPYRIVERIGEGGMGTIYLADQQTPVRRRVAVKVIKLGMDTKQVLARFDAERQALALMNHSCIAKIFDAGATPEGRPYFVMEHIVGVPIISYCDEHQLGIEERLRLFIHVCDGVQHAHQRGIIHRDLKPTNVLVSEEEGQPRPKIIDFGVAKASAQPLTEHTFLTASGQLIGTPEYMSPEQVDDAGADVDVRSDVYTLGIMLYELLTGALPIDPEELRRASFTEIVQKIRQSNPIAPSARWAQLATARRLAENRSMTPPLARRRIRGDLDWITMKALEKDRERRYRSPLELSTDIARHLNTESVLAAPPSVGYRMRKVIQRHKARSAVICLGVLTIVAGGIFSFLLALTRTREMESRRAALHYEEARTLDWHVDDGYLTSFPNAWGRASAEIIARVANKIYSGEASDDEMHQFAGAMMRYRLMGSPLQSLTLPRITLSMGGKRRAVDWTGQLGARVVPYFEINGEALDLSSREVGPVLLDLGRLDQQTVSFGDLPEVQSRFRGPGSYTIRGEMKVQLVRIESEHAPNSFPVTGADVARFTDLVGPAMEFPISPLDFTVLERMPFDGTTEEYNMPAGASPIDLTRWRADHYSPDTTPGIWACSPDGLSVEQVQHGGLTLFVSDEDMPATRFACTIQVLTAEDDDYTGLVFGYRGRDVGYYVFYWKQFGQPSTAGSMAIGPLRLAEGMCLIKVGENASIMEVLRVEPSSRVNVLASHVGRGTGWQDLQRYLIDVDYDPAGTIRLTVSEIPSGRLLWDSGPVVDPEPLGAGKIGFFNHSQTNVLYAAYDMPPAAPVTASE